MVRKLAIKIVTARDILGLVACLLILLALFPRDAAGGASEWTLDGNVMGGHCEVEVVNYPGNGFSVQVESCQVSVSVDPSLGVGPTLLLCRRESCLSGPCTPFTVLHSGELAGAIEGCADALASAPAPAGFQGWVGGNELYVLRVSPE